MLCVIYCGDVVLVDVWMFDKVMFDLFVGWCLFVLLNLKVNYDEKGIDVDVVCVMFLNFYGCVLFDV